MKLGTIIVALGVTAIGGLVLADGLPDKPKWAQAPSATINVLASQRHRAPQDPPNQDDIILAADDFQNSDQNKILGVRWWGGYFNIDPRPPIQITSRSNALQDPDGTLVNGFRFIFWTNDATGARPMPGVEMACREVDALTNRFSEEILIAVANLYVYEATFEPVSKMHNGVFQQKMWITIQAIMEPTTAQWGWQKSDNEQLAKASFMFVFDGSDEWVQWGHLSFEIHNEANCPGDLNGDGSINAADLAQLLGVWGPCAGCVEDLNGDDEVNAADLATLLGAWGPCP